MALPGTSERRQEQLHHVCTNQTELGYFHLEKQSMKLTKLKIMRTVASDATKRVNYYLLWENFRHKTCPTSRSNLGPNYNVLIC